MALVAIVDYRRFRDHWYVGWAAAVLLLALVVSPLGTESKGTQAWFQFGAFQLQPSEFAKPAVILALAGYASLHEGDLDIRRLGVAMGLVLVPIGLIFLQPDIGTILVFVAVMMGALLVAGARPRHIALLTFVGLIGVVGVLQMDVLEDYQRARLTAFIDPTDDLQRAAYNQNQSKIAIGAGGFTGAGLFRGSQTNLSYVPEQHTDFIFTAIGEELGFLGASTVLMLYTLMVWRTWRTAQLARDLSGTLICAGVMALLVFQVFQNVGMTMGIMPITGIPLPFLSYGGSATLAMFISVGLVLNVHMRRFA
jgi:rod shape determining protein RodA